MNIDKYLLLIKGEDCTVSVLSCRLDAQSSSAHIVYNNGKRYTYNIKNVRLFKNPRTVIPKSNIILTNDIPTTDVVKLHYFGKYCRIVYKSGNTNLVPSTAVKTSALECPKSENCFNYLKQLAAHVGLVAEDRNILSARYEKIDFIRKDSVLAAFLSGKVSNEIPENNTSVIYPFGFNLSQKKAVDNAMRNQISIIEGPPGTGKTQTILNIIANALMCGESVAVVSANNSANANAMMPMSFGEIQSPLFGITL